MILYRFYKLSLFSVSLASLGEHLRFIAWPSLVINIWNGQLKTQPSVSPFFSVSYVKPYSNLYSGQKKIATAPCWPVLFFLLYKLNRMPKDFEPRKKAQRKGLSLVER